MNIYICPGLRFVFTWFCVAGLYLTALRFAFICSCPATFCRTFISFGCPRCSRFACYDLVCCCHPLRTHTHTHTHRWHTPAHTHARVLPFAALYRVRRPRRVVLPCCGSFYAVCLPLYAAFAVDFYTPRAQYPPPYNMATFVAGWYAAAIVPPHLLRHLPYCQPLTRTRTTFYTL